MIKNIIFSSMLFFLLIAIPLALNGVTHVELGSPFLAFLKTCSMELESYKIQIPDIPDIPRMSDVSGFFVVVNILIQFFNGLINIINILITILNTIIQLIQFIFVILKNLISFKDSLLAQ